MSAAVTESPPTNEAKNSKKKRGKEGTSNKAAAGSTPSTPVTENMAQAASVEGANGNPKDDENPHMRELQKYVYSFRTFRTMVYSPCFITSIT